MKEIYRGYSIVATRRDRNKESEQKSKIPWALNNKLSRNQRNKRINVSGGFGIKVPNS